MVKVQKNKCNQITGTLSGIERGISNRNKTFLDNLYKTSQFSHDITLVFICTFLISCNPKVTKNNQVTLLSHCDTWITILTTFLKR